MTASDATDSTLHVASLLPLAPDRIAAIEAAAHGPIRWIAFEHREAWLARQLAPHGWDALLVGWPAGKPAEPADSAESPVRDPTHDGGGDDPMDGVGPDTAVLVVTDAVDAATARGWLRRGVQDVLQPGELAAQTLPLRLRAAVERQRRERIGRTAYATDLDTGLPHRQQLLETMSQLLALREREPAPMALLALRIEGLGTVDARLGREAANVLRRQVALRLRAGVRASDVVAALGDDRFAVLLGAVLTPADAQRVGTKLLHSVMEPLPLGGHELVVAAALGIAVFPRDGGQAEALLRRSVGLADSAQAQGRAGFACFSEADDEPSGAANDE